MREKVKGTLDSLVEERKELVSMSMMMSFDDGLSGYVINSGNVHDTVKGINYVISALGTYGIHILMSTHWDEINPDIKGIANDLDLRNPNKFIGRAIRRNANKPILASTEKPTYIIMMPLTPSYFEQAYYRRA